MDSFETIDTCKHTVVVARCDTEAKLSLRVTTGPEADAGEDAIAIEFRKLECELTGPRPQERKMQKSSVQQ